MRHILELIFTVTALTSPLVPCASAADTLRSEYPGIRVVDERLKLELFAEAPDIVTPVDLEVDERGRLIVIESHTHFRPKGYTGPKTDRIRVFEDTDGDGRADTASTFHDGENQTMGIKLHHNGWLYVATRREVFRIKDSNADGKADKRESLVKLETKGDYPHNGLNGFAFDFIGNVYFGFGENLGVPYKIIGVDGASLEGGGEGGNIYRITADGKKLTRIATGFWNPFGLGFDAFGNLFAVDNDPGGRPPCRLLHIVEGGDYGYRYRYGRGGRHPFTSWNGEVPGTLPMVAGTGEAPCEVIAYESDNLPRDYLGKLLVTSWGDHRIEAYDLQRKGASFTAKMKTVVQGDRHFRPVGMAIAPDGSVYFSDWVDKSYNLHGKGRIWRLSAKQPQIRKAFDATKKPVEAMAALDWRIRDTAARNLVVRDQKGMDALCKVLTSSNNPRAQAIAIEAIKQLDESGDSLLDHEQIRWTEAVFDGAPYDEDSFSAWILLARRFPVESFTPNSFHAIHVARMRQTKQVLVGHLGHDDPFTRHAAVLNLIGQPSFLKTLDPTTQKSGAARLGVLLALRRAFPAIGAKFLPVLLRDENAAIRFVATQWIGESRSTEHRGALLNALEQDGNNPRLIAAYIAALELLDGKKPHAADQIGMPYYLRPLLHDEKASAQVKVLALRATPASDPKLTMKLLNGFIAKNNAALRLEAVRTMRFSGLKRRDDRLMKIANNSKLPVALRAEAVAGLTGDSKPQQAALMKLAIGGDQVLRNEALRSLRGVELSSANRELLQQWASAHEEMAEPISKVLPDVKAKTRPAATDIDAWLKMTADQDKARGDAATGERIFFHPKAAGCFRCHRIDGRGANVGPDLSTIARSHDRKRLLESILQPSREIGPYYTVSLLELPDGDRVTAMNIGRDKGVDLWADASGRIHRIRWSDPVSRRALDTSLMPEGLHEALTTSELRDLLAFLETLK